MVQFFLPQRYEGDVRLRAATVVNAWPDSDVANLTVLLDGSNDGLDAHDRKLLASVGKLSPGPLFLSVSSAHEGSAPGEWRWPTFVGSHGGKWEDPRVVALEAKVAAQDEVLQVLVKRSIVEGSRDELARADTPETPFRVPLHREEPRGVTPWPVSRLPDRLPDAPPPVADASS